MAATKPSGPSATEESYEVPKTKIDDFIESKLAVSGFLEDQCRDFRELGEDGFWWLEVEYYQPLGTDADSAYYATAMVDLMVARC